MFDLFEPNPAVNVEASEYQRLLGLPKNYCMRGRTRELADAARQWYAQNGRPWIYAREISSLQRVDGILRLGHAEFSSRQLHDQFVEADSDSAVLVAVSAGSECEEYAQRLWKESKPDEYFFIEIFGSAVVEHLITVASGRICGWAARCGAAALPHYSPGYSGWDISDQIKLWNLIRQTGARHVGGLLEVFETGMLRPKKSLLAVIGLTRNLEKTRKFARLVPCERCSLPNCQYRRGPYRQALPQAEDVRALLSRAFDEVGERRNATALKPDAKYKTNVRALERWSKERLQLEFLPDGSAQAKFQYEGTTCSNMGRPLAFDYYVKLSPWTDRCRILEMSCGPAPGDTGHRFQCEYLNNAEAIMHAVAGEKPLLGRPLDEVLNWRRGYDPSGCFCNLSQREHKWGLVLEVIHFALARQERSLVHGQGKMILE